MLQVAENLRSDQGAIVSQGYINNATVSAKPEKDWYTTCLQECPSTGSGELDSGHLFLGSAHPAKVIQPLEGPPEGCAGKGHGSMEWTQPRGVLQVRCITSGTRPEATDIQMCMQISLQPLFAMCFCGRLWMSTHCSRVTSCDALVHAFLAHWMH